MEPRLPAGCARTYQVERWLASGGYGTVYLARHRELDRPVALKLLHSDALTDADAVERFLTEARITASLLHPHIVVLLDHGVDEGVPWIAYEYLPATTLRAVMEGPVPWPEALALARQIVSALAEAHGRGVLHRDVKPENVLRLEDGSLKVADFGTAKLFDGSGVTTQEGLILGTPAYLAPELIAGLPATPQSDVYAAGVVLHELLTGRVPFDRMEMAAAMRARLEREPPPPSAHEPGIPPEVDRLVLKAIARQRTDRFLSAAAFASAITRLLDRADHGSSTFVETSAIGARPKRRTRKTRRTRRTARTRVAPEPPAPAPAADRPSPRRVVLALALLTAVLGALAIALDRPRRPPEPAPLPPAASVHRR